MREYNLSEGSNLPAKLSPWGKVKDFLLQEVDLTAPVVLELSPKEERVLSDIHDFLFQDISWSDIKDFFLQDIGFEPIHDFLFQEITFGKKK